jgi:hypothetical protein
LIFGGPYHIIVPGVLMGASIDGEPDGQPDPNAMGDDLDGNDDEDGVFLSPLWPGGTATATIDLTSSVGGLLSAWIDFDADGSWSTTASEQIFGDQPLTGGVVNTLAFTVPASTTAGTVTYARFRFSTVSGLSPYGGAADGEVEDYEVLIEDGPPNYLFEFSLDIGSDIELSDPNTNGNEAADPGDVYWWQSAPIIPPGRDGFKDDLSIFGMDPTPIRQTSPFRRPREFRSAPGAPSRITPSSSTWTDMINSTRNCTGWSGRCRNSTPRASTTRSS